MTTPSGGLHLAALSSRLVTARSRAAGSPITHHGSTWVSKCRLLARRRTRSTARSVTSARSTSSSASRVGSSRASSVRSPMRVVSSSIWNRTSSSSSAREASDSPPCRSAWVSRSRLVRSEVSGVRSSWPASATSWRCRSREADRAVSIALKARASRAISSLPSTSIGSSFSVRAISSAASVSRRTGRRPLRATPQPASAAAITPAAPNRNITRPSLSSVCSLECERLGDDERDAVLASVGTAATRKSAVGGRRCVRQEYLLVPAGHRELRAPAERSRCRLLGDVRVPVGEHVADRAVGGALHERRDVGRPVAGRVVLRALRRPGGAATRRGSTGAGGAR